MDLYAENILEHYRHPRGKEPLNDASVTHEENNPSCGDAIEVRLMLVGDTITSMKWNGSGCAISQAAMSMLCEETEGKTFADVDRLTKEDVFAMLGVPVGMRRIKCALLGLHTLKNTVGKARGAKPVSWIDTIGDDGA